MAMQPDLWSIDIDYPDPGTSFNDTSLRDAHRGKPTLTITLNGDPVLTAKRTPKRSPTPATASRSSSKRSPPSKTCSAPLITSTMATMAEKTYQLDDGRTLTVNQDDDTPELAEYTLDDQVLTDDEAVDLIAKARRSEITLTSVDDTPVGG